MDLKDILSRLEIGNEEEIEKVLLQYNQENSQTFTFDHNEENLQSKVCQSLLTALGTQEGPCCQRASLETLRILSRDKRALDPVATREGLLVLAGLAQLHSAQDGSDPADSLQEDALTPEQERVVVEALKCLCNVVYNSPAAQQVCADLKLAHSLCTHLRSRCGRHAVGLFSLRLLFLLTALRPDVRVSLQSQLPAVRLLREVLERTLQVRWVGPYEAGAPEPETAPLRTEDNEQAMEALKAMFNLTLTDPSEEDGQHQVRLIIGVMRHLLLLRTETEEKTEEVHRLNPSYSTMLLETCPSRTSINTGLFLSMFKTSLIRHKEHPSGECQECSGSRENVVACKSDGRHRPFNLRGHWLNRAVQLHLLWRSLSCLAFVFDFFYLLGGEKRRNL